MTPTCPRCGYQIKTVQHNGQIYTWDGTSWPIPNLRKPFLLCGNCARERDGLRLGEAVPLNRLDTTIDCDFDPKNLLRPAE